MRWSVTLLSLGASVIAALTLGCARSRSAAPTCQISAASTVDPAAEARVHAWKDRLPSIFKFDFERTEKGSIHAIPRCVKTAGQAADYDMVVTSKIFSSDAIELSYEYVYTVNEPLSVDVSLRSDGQRWIGQESEDSILGMVGWRQRELKLPSCTTAEALGPESVTKISKSGPAVPVSSLVESSATHTCR